MKLKGDNSLKFESTRAFWFMNINNLVYIILQYLEQCFWQINKKIYQIINGRRT